MRHKNNRKAPWGCKLLPESTQTLSNQELLKLCGQATAHCPVSILQGTLEDRKTCTSQTFERGGRKLEGLKSLNSFLKFSSAGVVVYHSCWTQIGRIAGSGISFLLNSVCCSTNSSASFPCTVCLLHPPVGIYLTPRLWAFRELQSISILSTLRFHYDLSVLL